MKNKIKKLKKSGVFAVAVTRCLRLMLHLGRVPQAAAGSVLMHGVQTLPGHRIFSKAGAACCCWLGTWPHDPMPWDSMLLLIRALSP